jgi:hypothetical protein
MTFRTGHFSILLILVFILVVPFIHCGDDDDDDSSGGPQADDDDDDDDTDTGDADETETFDLCLGWYTDCVDLDEEIATDYCNIIHDAGEQGQCRLNAYATWLDCLIEGVECGNWLGSSLAIDQCQDQLLIDEEAC